MGAEMGVTPRAEDLRNWIPVRVYWREGAPMVDWCYMGNARFIEPFFDVTVSVQMRDNFSLLFRHHTPIHHLAGIVEQSPRLEPTGFIFHMSRCGSTLVAQMLAALQENIVISEAPPIDSVLNAHNSNPSVTDEQRLTWLRLMIGAMGRKRSGRERGFFVKFDSWNTFDIDLIERAFPDVPWIFLYRDPVEVMVSQMRKPGSQMIRGVMNRLLPGLAVMEALQMPGEEYCARVLARFCETALDRSDRRNALFVNYNRLPGAVTGEIARHFGISFSDEEAAKMTAAANFDAKTPRMPFASDSQSKREGATDAVHAAADAWLWPLYKRLEAITKNL
jgi:hypothetical protein